jgi:GAF domain-containing protein
MTSLTTAGALARVGAALAEGRDALDALSTLTRLCAVTLPAEAVGVVVAGDVLAPDPGTLELVAASSHAAAALELYQAQTGQGPCVDAVVTGQDVRVAGAAAMRERWPGMAPAVAAARLESVHALPLRWRGATFGALNVFSRDPAGVRAPAARAFADLATVAVVHAEDRPTLGGVARAVDATLRRRVAVEQAKGVVMQLRGVDGGAAFDALVREAGRRGAAVTDVAAELLAEVPRGNVPAWVRPTR